MSRKYEQILDDIKELVGKYEILENDNNYLCDTICNLTYENEKLEYEIGELKNKNDIFNRSYISKVKECYRQSKKNADLHNTISEMQKVIDELNKENVELKDESKQDKTTIRCLGYDIDKLQKEIKDLKTELDMFKEFANFGSRFKIKTGSMNPGEINMTLELDDQFSVTVTERWDTHE